MKDFQALMNAALGGTQTALKGASLAGALAQANQDFVGAQKEQQGSARTEGATLLEDQLYAALVLFKSFVRLPSPVPLAVDNAMKAFEDQYINIVKWTQGATDKHFTATFKGKKIGGVQVNPYGETNRWHAHIDNILGAKAVRATFDTRHEAEDWVETNGKPKA